MSWEFIGVVPRSLSSCNPSVFPFFKANSGHLLELDAPVLLLGFLPDAPAKYEDSRRLLHD